MDLPSYDEAMRMSRSGTPTPTAPALDITNSPYDRAKFNKWDEYATRIMISRRLRMNDDFENADTILEVDKLWNLTLLELIEKGYNEFSVLDLKEYWLYNYEIYKSIVENSSSDYDRSWIYFRPMHAVFKRHLPTNPLTYVTTSDPWLNSNITADDITASQALLNAGAPISENFNPSNGSSRRGSLLTGRQDVPVTSQPNGVTRPTYSDVVTTQPTRIPAANPDPRNPQEGVQDECSECCTSCCWLCTDDCCNDNQSNSDNWTRRPGYRNSDSRYDDSYDYGTRYCHNASSLVPEIRVDSDDGWSNGYTSHRHGDTDNSSGHHGDAGNSSDHHSYANNSSSGHYSYANNSSSGHHSNDNHSSSGHHGSSHCDSAADYGASSSGGHYSYDSGGGGCYDSGGGGFDSGGGCGGM